MKKLFLIHFAAYFLITNLYGQQIKYYHKFRTSDSHIILLNWCIEPNEKGEKYIIETVDDSSRVIELRFINNGSLIECDCYNNPIIKFKYEPNKIIQFNYCNDSTLSAGIECGAPAKIEYKLKDNLIIDCREFPDYDTYLNGNFELDDEFRKQLENEKELNKDGIKSNYTYIEGYVFSRSKYKGFLPVSSQFEAGDFYLPYSDNALDSEFSIKFSKLLHQKN